MSIQHLAVIRPRFGLNSPHYAGILLPDAMNQASLPFSYSQETRDYIKNVTENQKLRFIVTVPPGITSSSGKFSC